MSDHMSLISIILPLMVVLIPVSLAFTINGRIDAPTIVIMFIGVIVAITILPEITNLAFDISNENLTTSIDNTTIDMDYVRVPYSTTETPTTTNNEYWRNNYWE